MPLQRGARGENSIREEPRAEAVLVWSAPLLLYFCLFPNTPQPVPERETQTHTHTRAVPSITILMTLSWCELHLLKEKMAGGHDISTLHWCLSEWIWRVHTAHWTRAASAAALGKEPETSKTMTFELSSPYGGIETFLWMSDTELNTVLDLFWPIGTYREIVPLIKSRDVFSSFIFLRKMEQFGGLNWGTD